MTRNFTALFIGASALVQFSAIFAGAPKSPDSSVHANLWPDAAPVVSRTDQTDRFVERLLSQLSLEEKVGQMIQADIASISPAELRQYKLGSILAGGNAAPGNELRTTPQAWLDLTGAFYRASLGDVAAPAAGLVGFPRRFPPPPLGRWRGGRCRGGRSRRPPADPDPLRHRRGPRS